MLTQGQLLRNATPRSHACKHSAGSEEHLHVGGSLDKAEAVQGKVEAVVGAAAVGPSWVPRGSPLRRAVLWAEGFARFGRQQLAHPCAATAESFVVELKPSRKMSLLTVTFHSCVVMFSLIFKLTTRHLQPLKKRWLTLKGILIANGNVSIISNI